MSQYRKRFDTIITDYTGKSDASRCQPFTLALLVTNWKFRNQQTIAHSTLLLPAWVDAWEYPEWVEGQSLSHAGFSTRLKICSFQLLYASLPFKEPRLDLKLKITLMYISYPCSKLTVHFFSPVLALTFMSPSFLCNLKIISISANVYRSFWVWRMWRHCHHFWKKKLLSKCTESQRLPGVSFHSIPTVNYAEKETCVHFEPTDTFSLLSVFDIHSILHIPLSIFPFIFYWFRSGCVGFHG